MEWSATRLRLFLLQTDQSPEHSSTALSQQPQLPLVPSLPTSPSMACPPPLSRLQLFVRIPTSSFKQKAKSVSACPDPSITSANANYDANGVTSVVINGFAFDPSPSFSASSPEVSSCTASNLQPNTVTCSFPTFSYSGPFIVSVTAGGYASGATSLGFISAHFFIPFRLNRNR